MAAEPLRFLLLEDNPADAELVQFELEEAGFVFTVKAVMTEEDFVRELQEFSPDLILSDYDLPKYNGALALAEAKRRRPDIPFILVTGAVTEDRAIEILTQGAKDYVLKTRLQQRLGSAVRRALAEAEEHRARKQAEAELREAYRTLEERVKVRTADLEAEMATRKKTEVALQDSEKRYRRLFEASKDGILILDADTGKVVDVNPFLLQLLGYSYDALCGQHIWEIGAFKDIAASKDAFKALQENEYIRYDDLPLETRTGQSIAVEFVSNVYLVDHSKVVQCNIRDITKRKKAEEQIAREKQLQQLLLDHFPGVVLLLRTTTREVVASNQAGNSVGAVCGSICFETWGQGQEPCPWCLAQDLWATGKEQIAVIDAGEKVFEAHWVPVADDLYMHYAFDITERIRAEEKLRQNEQTIQQALSISNSFTFDWDTATDQVHRSASCGKIFGIDGDEMCHATARRFSQRVHPDDRTRFEKLLHNLTPAANTYTTDYRLVLSDGSVVMLEETAQAFFDAAGKTKQVIGVATDITKRKQVEEALRKSEHLYRAIGESIDYGIWICDPEGRNIYASKSFLDLVGVTQEQCSNFGWGDVLHPDDAERTIAAWKECVRTGSMWDIEHRFRGVDGQWHSVLARGVPVRDVQGEVICWAGINLDISRRKKAEMALEERTQQLEDANKELESFRIHIPEGSSTPTDGNS